MVRPVVDVEALRHRRKTAWPTSPSSSAERVSKYPGGKEGHAPSPSGYLGQIREKERPGGDRRGGRMAGRERGGSEG